MTQTILTLQSSLDTLNLISNDNIFSNQEKYDMAESFRRCHNAQEVIYLANYWLKQYLLK
jgi:cell division GTPase FtsZ